MDELTIFELIELIRMNEEAMATQFQVWLSITFATIVAVFAGRELLNKPIKWLVTMLYLLASLATTASSIYLAEGNAKLAVILTERGAHFSAPVFAGATFFILFLAGVCTTVYFIQMDTKARKEPA